MGRIMNITNFNRYCGRFSRKANPKTAEVQLGWFIRDSLLEKFPVLALRRRDYDNRWPFCWKKGRNLNHAIDLALKTLKAWQAFRPKKSDGIVRDLTADLPSIIIALQRSVCSIGITKIHGMKKLGNSKYCDGIKLLATTVGEISAYKTDAFPMLGSKVMHFFFPELFPVWDTKWIKTTCLAKEKTTSGDWLPQKVEKALGKFNPATLEYANYLALMLEELYDQSMKELKNLERAYIRYSEINDRVIKWHFGDITPLLFEVCLLGKHI